MPNHLKIFFSKSDYLATAVGFFLLGFLFGNWASLIPYIKSYFALNDATLGLLLLCLPLGAMSFNPVAAKLIQKFGQKEVTIFGILFIPLAYLAPFLVANVFILPITMVVVGISMTILNIAINMQATILEQTYNQSIMSTCHGMFSVGLMVGSLMRSATLLFEISEVAHMIIMVVVSLMIGFSASLHIFKMHFEKAPNKAVEEKSGSTSSGFKLPSGVLLTIIIISICINFTEGSMSDWTSVYMNEVVKTSPYFVGWGLFGYSSFMALGRLFGDGIIPVYGRNRVLKYGAVLSFIGVMTVLILPYTFTAIVGFGLVGLGVSCGSPILYSSATRISGLTGENGLATMNFYAMAGFLGGPVLIGFISEKTNLAIAFVMIMVLAALWYYKTSNTELP